MADEKTTESTKQNRTAGEAGWHVSRYNLSAPVPGTKKVAIANLFRGTCAEYTPIEGYLMSVLDELDEHHPIIERLAKRGVICNFDEEAVDKPQFSFGTAHDWNPEDPLGSASKADNAGDASDADNAGDAPGTLTQSERPALG